MLDINFKIKNQDDDIIKVEIAFSLPDDDFITSLSNENGEKFISLDSKTLNSLMVIKNKVSELSKATQEMEGYVNT